MVCILTLLRPGIHVVESVSPVVVVLVALPAAVGVAVVAVVVAAGVVAGAVAGGVDASASRHQLAP